MRVGCVKEIKTHEYRVGLIPAHVQSFVEQGHEVWIEKGAGAGSGFSDEAYTSYGAVIADGAEEVWNTVDMMLKVKEPLASEYPYFRKDLILFTYLHLAADEELTKALMASGMTAYAYETLEHNGSLPLLKPMSEVAGRLSIQEAAKYLEKPFGGKGLLMGGVPGVKKAKVMIIGGGTAGRNAAKVALGMGADVTVFDRNSLVLEDLDNLFDMKVKTLYSTPASIQAMLPETDVVIGAVLIPGAKAPKLIKREDLSLMQPGSVLVDIAVDQGGCFETTHATSHLDPVYTVDGIIHYCVANMPGAVPMTSTLALNNATLRAGLIIASMGKDAYQNNYVKSALNIYHGKLVNEAVAESFGLEFERI